MNIAIEARSLSLQGGGVKTYAYELLQHLRRYQKEAQFTVVTSQAALPKIHEWRYTVLPVPVHYAWETFFNTWLTRRVQGALADTKPNLVHYTKAAMPNRPRYPSVVTIHDVIPILFPQSQAIGPRLYWPRALQHAADTSTHILTISETSKRDIVRYLHADPDKITVTPLAVNHTMFTPQSDSTVATILTQLSLTTPYILFLATRDMRKNITGLLSAFAQIATDIPHTLVIAGKQALRHDHTEEKATQLGLKSRVKFLDFVPFDSLPSLYTGADLFVFPSVYEGSSLPVLEAMACGTPVIVSDGAALAEVVGEAGAVVRFTTDDLLGRLHDQGFISELAKTMLRVLHDGAKRERMKQQGLIQATKTSWDDVAAATWQVYQKFAV